MTRTALITIAHGRHGHWQTQRAALARSHERPTEHVLVVMDDPTLADLPTEGEHPPHVIHVPTTARGLPLARARNIGAASALSRNADVLVFLDVDCLPDPDLISAYRAAATAQDTTARLISGPVTYLEPLVHGTYDLDSISELDDPHPARPAPGRGEIQLGGSHDLFWSLSFAVHANTWHRIGGFNEEYVGYGGEDTDFAWTARDRGVDLAWIGDARAYHQHHEVEDPPVRHLDDILRNAALFRKRWGVWPMNGWLQAFLDLGLIEHTEDTKSYRRREEIAPVQRR